MNPRIKAGHARSFCNRRAWKYDLDGILSVEDVLNVWEFTGWRCFYCNADGHALRVHLSVDHVTPLNQGGENSIWNIVPACKHCNSCKGDRDVYWFLRHYGRSKAAFDRRFKALHKYLRDTLQANIDTT